MVARPRPATAENLLAGAYTLTLSHPAYADIGPTPFIAQLAIACA